MKTQILQIEPHDDANSTRDKMGRSQTSRILLVWPTRGRVLARHLDLVLLQRHSQALGAQLALVVSDPEVRNQARQLGIATFNSIAAAQRTRWRRPNPGRTKKRITSLEARALIFSPRPVPASRPLTPSAKLGFFTLGVLSVLSIAAVLFPRAEIRLKPATQIQEISLSARASQSLQRVNASGLLPLHLRSVVVEGRDQIETSGMAQIPDRSARGQVVFTNLTDRAVAIPSGTEVSSGSSGVRYATARDGKLAAGPGTTISLPVTATLPGSSGNLAVSRILAILGPLSTELTVTNPVPIRGGSDRASPAPTRQDQEQLRERLRSTLQTSAQEEAQLQLQPGDLLLEPNLTLKETLEETFTPSGIEPAYLLELSLRLEFQALVLSGKDLNAFASQALDANLPQGYIPIDDEVNIDWETSPEILADGDARLALLASREFRASPPQAEAANLVLGLSPAQAARRLASVLPLATSPQITLQPTWWPRLPIVPLRITVVMDQ